MALRDAKPVTDRARPAARRLPQCTVSRKSMSARDRIRRLLDSADVRLDGDRARDIRVHDEAFLHRVLAHGSLGLGESYMDGCWDAVELDSMICRLLDAQLDRRVRTLDDYRFAAQARLFNLPTRRPFEIGRRGISTKPRSTSST
jgi:cyclopropane-fatty-acyl-phospholipid synthase